MAQVFQGLPLVHTSVFIGLVVNGGRLPIGRGSLPTRLVSLLLGPPSVCGKTPLGSKSVQCTIITVARNRAQTQNTYFLSPVDFFLRLGW